MAGLRAVKRASTALPCSPNEDEEAEGKAEEEAEEEEEEADAAEMMMAFDAMQVNASGVDLPLSEKHC